MNAKSEACMPAELLIGIQGIDTQHEQLFQRLSMMKDICLRDGALPLSEAEALVQALEEHYATEASFAGDHGVDFSGHAEKHRLMLQMLGKSLNEIVEGRADVYSTLRYVEYWFERHIVMEDMSLGELATRIA